MFEALPSFPHPLMQAVLVRALVIVRQKPTHQSVVLENSGPLPLLPFPESSNTCHTDHVSVLHDATKVLKPRPERDTARAPSV